MKKKEYKDVAVGEGLITVLEQAIDYEKGGSAEGVKSRKIFLAPIPHYKSEKIKEKWNHQNIR